MKRILDQWVALETFCCNSFLWVVSSATSKVSDILVSYCDNEKKGKKEGIGWNGGRERRKRFFTTTERRFIWWTKKLEPRVDAEGESATGGLASNFPPSEDWDEVIEGIRREAGRRKTRLEVVERSWEREDTRVWGNCKLKILSLLIRIPIRTK